MYKDICDFFLVHVPFLLLLLNRRASELHIHLMLSNQCSIGILKKMCRKPGKENIENAVHLLHFYAYTSLPIVSSESSHL